MSQKMSTGRKTVMSVVVVLIVVLALVAVVPMVYSAIMGPGVRTEGLSAENAQPATTDLDGQWQVVTTRDVNTTAVGFTFFEILPGERKNTSGSTQAVEGSATVDNEELTAGEIVVDMTEVTTDNQRRDVNVAQKILFTDDFPTASFTVTEPADVSQVPDDGTSGTVTLVGDLEIHGETNQVTHEFDALRDGDLLIISGDLPINRLDYGVESPEFVAAAIDEEGELNIRIAMEKV